MIDESELPPPVWGVLSLDKPKEILIKIKFRGKRIDNGEWVYGSLLDGDIIVVGSVDADEDYIEINEWYSVVRGTVSQYTGLKDKNGKEIYDGDILWRYSMLTGKVHCYKVAWDEENARFMSCGKQEPVSSALERGYVLVGNVWEHPELLEGKA